MMQNKNRIAVTGGMGSGKSTVCEIIRKLGLPVVSCDEEYRELLNNSEFVQILAEEFGNILLPDGKINKGRLAEIVFNDPEKLKKLNSLTHPKIMDNVYKKADNYSVCFCEVPLLFESGLDKDFDKVIVVLRDKGERIKSVINRNGLRESVVKSRLLNQFDYDRANFEQYYVIHNDKSISDLNKQTVELIEKLNLPK